MKLLKAFWQAVMIVLGIIVGVFVVLAVVAAAQYGPIWVAPAVFLTLVIALFTGLLYEP